MISLGFEFRLECIREEWFDGHGIKRNQNFCIFWSISISIFDLLEALISWAYQYEQ